MEAWFAAKEAGAFPVIGAVDDAGALLGFATYGAFRDRPAYKYTVESSVYVRADRRGRGVGRALLGETIARARARQVHTLVAGIETSNDASKALHARFGFEPCGVVRQAGFKFGRWLDLAFYQLLLDGPAAPRDGPEGGAG
jgi:phosphinothricin acetyltransferase